MSWCEASFFCSFIEQSYLNNTIFYEKNWWNDEINVPVCHDIYQNASLY